MNNKYELLESTGHSFSGIHDIIHNSPEDKIKLLHQIDDKYNEVVAKQLALEEELDSVKSSRRLLVSDFRHFHKSLNVSTRAMVFQRDRRVVKVFICQNEKIEYVSDDLTLLEIHD
jgi:hypothetical protein